VQRLHFDGWEEFRRFLEAPSADNLPYVWRGQRHPDWPLASSLERQLLASDDATDGAAGSSGDRKMRDQIQQHLERFKQSASGLRGPSPKDLSDEQWWALGRHYGLITPLLDWTEKPFVALFFALRGAAPLAGWESHAPVRSDCFAMYRLTHAPQLEDATLAVVRTPIDELGRMQQQRGLFTWNRSHAHVDLVTLLDDTGRGDLLTQATVSTAAIPEALRDLELHGIDHRQLFPDMFGAAAHANVQLELHPVIGERVEGPVSGRSGPSAGRRSPPRGHRPPT
jgi:hypothetical protein